MRKYELPVQPYRTDTLSEALKKVPGVRGISGRRDTGGDWIENGYDVDLADDAPPGVEAQIDAIVLSHDSDERTAEEVAEETRKTALEDARRADRSVTSEDIQAATTIAALRAVVLKLHAEMTLLRLELEEARGRDLG